VYPCSRAICLSSLNFFSALVSLSFAVSATERATLSGFYALDNFLEGGESLIAAEFDASA
jgi:hypothetical protein